MAACTRLLTVMLGVPYSHSLIFSSYTVTVAGGTANRELRKKLDENRGCAARQKLGQWVDYLRTRGVAVDWPPEPDLQTAIAHMVTCYISG